MKYLFLVPKITSLINQRYFYLEELKENSEVITFPDVKWKASEWKQWIQEEILPLKAEKIVVADATIFKVLTKTSKVSNTLGIGYSSSLVDGEIYYIPSYLSAYLDPEKIQGQIDLVLNRVIQTKEFLDPKTLKYQVLKKATKDFWKWLIGKPKVWVDIEATALKHYEAKLYSMAVYDGSEGFVLLDPEDMKTVFTNFHMTCKVFHNISYDATILISNLFMSKLTDREGMLKGMHHVLANWEDTKLIAYLATNSCAGNDLSLKGLAHEYAGDYAVEIQDILSLVPEEVYEYNFIDTVCTKYVEDKFYPLMVQDGQEEIYRKLFKPAVIDIIQMQLTGMPLNMEKVIQAEKQLQEMEREIHSRIYSNPIINKVIRIKNIQWVEKKNKTLKKLKKTLEDANEQFLLSSPDDLQILLYGVLKLPVLSTTGTGLPSTGTSTLEKLSAHATEANKAFLKDILDYKKITKLLTAFIPHMKAAPECDGWHYLYGFFNLGGTVSGRLSSSKINLQQLPSSGLGKILKDCFEAPPGWIFVGLDFASLEDRISALTTKDPEKLKVYLENYDGHCLRAFKYFSDQMPDIKEAQEGQRCFEVEFPDGTKQYLIEGESLTYEGRTDHVERFFEQDSSDQ